MAVTYGYTIHAAWIVHNETRHMNTRQRLIAVTAAALLGSAMHMRAGALQQHGGAA